MKKSLYEKATKRREVNGRYRIDCIRGLWGVDAPTKNQATAEAMHYFLQYQSDGEYDFLEDMK